LTIGDLRLGHYRIAPRAGHALDSLAVERDAEEDLSGARPVRIDGEMYFTYRIAMLVTRKLPARA
jgi:hypothetical protein